MSTQDDERIVITGVGIVCSTGNTKEEFWDNLIRGKSKIRTLQNVTVHDGTKIAHLDYFHSNFGAEIDLTPEILARIKSKKMIKRLDSSIIYACAAGREAVEDSTIEIEKAPHRYGTILGTGGSGIKSYYDASHEFDSKNVGSGHPMRIVNAIPNTPSSFFAQENNLQGPCFTVSSACASSNHSIGLAATLIRSGMADAIYAGGAEAALNPLAIHAFANISALSKRSDSPLTASRPFDQGRDGFVMADGSAIVCVESLRHARKRGAKIYCELVGFGFSSDAYDLVAPEPNGRGASSSIQSSLQMARLNPQDIDLINTHATSTPLGDVSEYRGVRQVLGSYANTVPVHSTKSITGHLLGGAGAVECIAIVLAFEQGIAHHTINQFKQDQDIGFNVIKNEPMELQPAHVLSNGFGFGGQNSSLIFAKMK